MGWRMHFSPALTAMFFSSESTVVGLCAVYREMLVEMTEDEAKEVLRFGALLKGETVDFTWKPFRLNVVQWGPEHDDLVARESSAFIFECEIGWEFNGTLYPIGRVRNYISSGRLASRELVEGERPDGVVAVLRFEPGESNQGNQVLLRGSE